MKALVFGSGKYFLEKQEAIKDDIIGFVDNHKKGTFSGKPVYRPKEIQDLIYDVLYIMVGPQLVAELTQQILAAGVDPSKIKFGQNLFPRNEWEHFYMKNEIALMVDANGLIYNNGQVKVRVYRELFGVVEMLGGNMYGYGQSACNSVVLDIGMNIGLASLYFASRNEVSKVYAYEPFVDTYEEAIRNFSLNEKLAQKIIPQNVGLSNEAKTETIFYNECMPGALTTCQDLVDKSIQLFKESGGVYEKEKEQAKKIYLLNAADEIEKVISENRGKNFVLKMDCEGSEYSIIASLEKRDLLREFSIIMLEWHFKGSQNIKESLIKAGFSFFEQVINERIGLINAIRVYDK